MPGIDNRFSEEYPDVNSGDVVSHGEQQAVGAAVSGAMHIPFSERPSAFDSADQTDPMIHRLRQEVSQFQTTGRSGVVRQIETVQTGQIL